MNIKKNFPEDYVNFVDTTAKENTCFKLIIVLFVISISLFSFFSYLNT